MKLAVNLVVDDKEGFYEFEITGSRADDYQVKRERARFGPIGDQSEFAIESSKWIVGPKDLRPQIEPMSLALPVIGGDLRFKPLVDHLKNIAIYSIFPDTLRGPQKPDPTRPMDEHGSNWGDVIRLLKKSELAAQFKAALVKVVGDIDDFRTKQAGGYLVTEFRHGTARKGTEPRQKWFESLQESDGTLRMAGILTALLQDPPLTLLGVEEPELTIHPGVIPILFDFLKQASQVQQILITTHSPELLDLLNVEDIRVVARKDGITTIHRIHEKQWSLVREDLFRVGDFMRTGELEPGEHDGAVDR
jgi:predicted ATPase